MMRKSLSFLLILIISLAIVPIVSSSSLQEEGVLLSPSFLTPIPQIAPENSSPSIFAFYYPWYGTPAVSGEWVHWEDDYPNGIQSY